MPENIFSRRFEVALCCLLAAGSLAASVSHTLGQEKPTEPQPPRDDRGLRFKAPGKYWNIGVPKCVTEAEIHLYGDMLNLSEAQRRILSALYESYLREDAQFKDDKVQKLWDRGAEFAAMTDQVSRDLPTAEAFVDLIDQFERTLPALESIEDRLWAGLEPMLDESQLTKLASVRNLRKRTRYISSYPAIVPGTSFDLVVALYNLKEKDFDLTARDSVAFDQFLADYDNQLTHIAAARLRHRAAAGKKSYILLARTATLSEQGNSAAASLLHQEYLGLLKEDADADRRVHDLNKHYVDLLCEQLPAETAAALKSLFLEHTYRPVYPNMIDLDPIIRTLSTVESLDGERREEVKTICTAYAEIERTIADQMTHRHLEWRAEIGNNRGYTQDGYQAYRQEMQKLQRLRRTHAELHLSLLIAELAEQELEQLKPDIDAFRRNCAADFKRAPSDATQLANWPQPYG